jgi:hypothetical protein
MSACYTHNIPSTKSCIHVKTGSVTTYQEATYANARGEQDLMAQILDANHFMLQRN